MSKFKSNTIIIGYVNTYCLVCDCYFQTLEATLDHIETNEHSAQLEAHPYMVKYGNNCIKKVSKGYYCELCYLLLASPVKVSLHIGQPGHLSNKRSQIKRLGNIIIINDDILIEDKAWHSICDGTCAICNVEFDNEDLHRNEQTHQLKLVQSKLHYNGNNDVYRKTDDMFCHCITCNVVFEYNTRNIHFDAPQHKNAYAKCQEDLKKYLEKIPINTEKKPTTIDKSNTTDKNLTSVDYKLNTIENKPTTSKVDVKPESETVDNEIKDEIVSESKTLVVNSSKSKKEDLKANEVMEFCQNHNFTYMEGRSYTYCRCCETKVPANLRGMKEHVSGKEHVTKSKCIGHLEEKICLKKLPVNEYVIDMVALETPFGSDIIINDRICISILSFVLLDRVDSQLHCFVCDVKIPEWDGQSHANTARHESKTDQMSVITNLGPKEFVRELRKELFHCGHCNLLVKGSNNLLTHLRSESHLGNKRHGCDRFKNYAPQLSTRKQRLEDHMMAVMFSRKRF